MSLGRRLSGDIEKVITRKSDEVVKFQKECGCKICEISKITFQTKCPGDKDSSRFDRG
jgi:Fe-S cluster biogenesis protein NfuA